MIAHKDFRTNCKLISRLKMSYIVHAVAAVTLCYSCLCIIDKQGRWVFRSSRQRCEHRRHSYNYQCRRWTAQQKKQYHNGRYFTSRLPPCPCFLWQAAWDPRYYVDDAINCAILAFPFSLTTIAQVQLLKRNSICLLPNNV